MRAIPGKNTRPELAVRTVLHRAGFRYRIHPKHIRGKPDIVLRKYGAIILVNGCFWHGHNCHIFKMPKQESWQAKIKRNRERDRENLAYYEEEGWKVLQVWECAIQGKNILPRTELIGVISSWIQYDPLSAELEGRNKLYRSS